MRRLKTFGALSSIHPFGPSTGMVGLNGWNGSTRYEQTNAGPAGAGTMSRVVIFRADAVPNVFNGLMQRGGFPAVAAGWFLDITNGAAIRFGVANGVPTSVVAPTYTIVAGDVGKVFCVFGINDGAGFLRLYQSTAGVVAQVGAGTAIVGYTGAAAGDDFMVGNAQNLVRPATQVTIVSVAGSDTAAWTLAQMQAICDDVRASYRISQATPGETFRYNARNAAPPAGNWLASAGADLTPLGAVFASVLKQQFPPVFR